MGILSRVKITKQCLVNKPRLRKITARTWLFAISQISDPKLSIVSVAIKDEKTIIGINN